MMRALVLFLAGCGTTMAMSDAGTDSGASCALAQNTSVVSNFANCDLLARDTSSCKSARTAAGLSGFWLDFSCRVSLEVANGNVTVKGDSQPDYISQYFPDGNACKGPQTSMVFNPNRIAAQNIQITVPLAPTSTASQAMQLGAVGLAVNGVAIFDNAAGPGDDIYKEVASFDACGGHPMQMGGYHYHTEPYSISHDDARFIGVMRDGYPIYGRKDTDGSTPMLDAQGGHTSATSHSTTPVYHYHANLQTSASNQMAWFLTTGTYHGAPGACTGCL